MDSLLNTTGQQLPNNHFVDPQVWSLILFGNDKKKRWLKFFYTKTNWENDGVLSVMGKSYFH